ncbi:MAG: DUF5117 domain-containing protein, partial [bacterium]|nr:DUF5117 domain-containing protein [bacterium]
MLHRIGIALFVFFFAASGLVTTRGAGAESTQPVQEDAARPKPAAEATPKEAAPKVVTKNGMFNILEAEGKTFFEIPSDFFGRELFWYAEVVEDPPETDGILGNAVGTAVVRFDKQGGAVYLRDLSDRTKARTHFTQGQADAAQPSSASKLKPVVRAVAAADYPPVMYAFADLGAGPNGGTVIEVTGLFANDVDEFSVADALASDPFGGGLLVGPIDGARSSIQQSLAFPKNVHIRARLTFRPATAAEQLGAPSVPPAETPLSVVVGHSIALLPAEPMKARLFDD